MGKRQWRRKYEACERLARDQAGTAEGRAAAAKAAQIEAKHLQPEPQPRRAAERRSLRGYARVAEERYKSYSRRARAAAEADYDFGGVPDSCLE